MKKLIKVLIILVAVGTVLLLAASLLLHIYLPPEKAKKLVLDKLSTQLKREVKLGDVSVGVLTGLRMTGLKISESPNFTKGIFISSDEFSLKVALAPLIFKKITVRQIVLKHPEVNVIRNADGKTFNFSDLTGSAPPASAAAPAPVASAVPASNPSVAAPSSAPSKEPSPFLLLVSRAEIDDGAVHFIDRSPAKQSIDIAPFALSLENVSLTTPFSVQTTMHIKAKGSDLAIAFGGDVDLLSGTFKIKQGSVVSQDTKIVLSGEANQLKTSEPAVDLKIDIPQLNLANFAAFVAMPPGVRIEGLWTGHAALIGNQKSMNLDALLDGSKTKIQYSNTFSKPEKIPLSVAVQGTLKDLESMDIQKLELVLASLSVTGKGQVNHATAPQPAFSLHFESNSFSLPELLHYAPGALPPGITITGNNRISADLSGTPANAQFAVKWDGTDLAITKEAQFVKPAATPLEVEVFGNAIAPGKVVVKNLTVRLGANQLAGSGTVESQGTQSVVNFGAKGANWSMPDLAKLSPLLAPYHPTGSLSFDVHAAGPTSALQTSVQTSADIAMAEIKQENYEGKNLQLKWNLTQITPDLSKVSGTASLRQGPGQITNVQKLAASSRIGKIALGPLNALAQLQQKGLFKDVALPSLQSIAFDSIVGDYVLHTGVMEVKTFDLNGQALSISDQGTVGLAGAQPLNMTVLMKLAAGSLGGTIEQLVDKDDKGRPMLKFFVTGTAADPKVKLDLKEVGQKAVQQVGQELLKNPNVQNAVDNLQKSFKGLFH